MIYCRKIEKGGDNMERKNIVKICMISSIILVVLAMICIGMGFNKMLNYKNSDTYQYKSVNAYVGGDAYNYMINASYFTGYVSLGGCLLIASSIFATTGIKTKNIEEKKKSHSM